MASAVISKLIDSLSSQSKFIKLSGWFGGRTTLFAVFFSLSCLGLALAGKLTSVYATFAIGMTTAMVGKSAADDYHDRNSDSGSTQN